MNLTTKDPCPSPSRLSSPGNLPCPSCVDDHTAPQTPAVSSTRPASWADFSLAAVLLPLLFLWETPVYPSRQLHCLLFCEVFPCPFTCISGPGHCPPHHIILHVSLVVMGPPMPIPWLRVRLPMQGMWIWSLGQEGPLEKEMTTHSSLFFFFSNLFLFFNTKNVLYWGIAN